MTNKPLALVFLLTVGIYPAVTIADEPVPAKLPGNLQTIQVEVLAASPAVDGSLDEWSVEGWQVIRIQPAVENDEKNRLGNAEVQFRAGVHEGRLYIAARWPDVHADRVFKTWNWTGSKYCRGKQQDDMFALRFDLDGDYDTCMLSDRSYRVDTWLWSAGRSDPAGFAEDTWQTITTKYTENAAEYTSPTGDTIYIRKGRDAGSPIYRNTRPERKKFAGDKLPGIEQNESPSGSVADVRGKGEWLDGYWHLEMSRKLETGYEDDTMFQSGDEKMGAIAVFDRNHAEHKSVSGSLLFDFSALR